MKSIARRALLAGISVAALGWVSAASADTLVYNGPAFSPYYGTYTINDGGSYTPVTAYAGAFQMTDTSGATLPAGSSFMAWCVDIFDDMNTSGAGTQYTLRTGSAFYGAGSSIVTNLDRLASYVFDNSLLTGNQASAAFQLAAWEIVNETTAATFQVSSGPGQGNFYVTTSNGSSAVNLANTWLGIVNAGTYAIDEQLSVWQQNIAGSTQNLAVFAPVPEPASSLMLLSGIGLMAFVARRRRKAREIDS